MSDELRPCPFCGSKPKLDYLDYNEPKHQWFIRCGSDHDDCIVHPFLWCESEETAIAVWNKRDERGTCHVTKVAKLNDNYGFKLSCGHSMVNPFDDHPNYCPWCGAEVVDR